MRKVTVVHVAVRINTTTTTGTIVMTPPGTLDLGTSPAINRKSA